MSSGGSSGHAASGSRSFAFGSDDVLCSYEDCSPQDPAKGRRPDPSAKDFHESRMGRPVVGVYDQQEGHPKDDVISAVEKCMKKYADNLLRSLEGISERLSQLELHCYNLEQSISEFQSDMFQDQKENDLNLKSLEKHLQEVDRSVQILRDKQELAATQKDLSKLQLVQKESTTLSHSQKNEEDAAPKRPDVSPDTPNQQLALVPHQTAAPPPLPSRACEQNQPYNQLSMQPAQTGMGTFYAQHQSVLQDQQRQALQPELQYGQPRPQIQQDQATAPQQQTPFPQYQQQWPQPPPQPFPMQAVQSQHPPPSHAQIRPQTPPTYAHQPTNPYSAVPQPAGTHAEAVAFGYGGPGSTAPQPLPHYNMQRQLQPQGSQSCFGHPSNKGGYSATASYPPQANVQGGYNAMYGGGDGSRGAHSQNFQPGGHPPPSDAAAQNPLLAGGPHHTGPPQPIRSHPYGEMIERAVSMGYARDQVVSVVQRMGETGQPVDFNTLLDRLNDRAAAGATPRGWSS